MKAHALLIKVSTLVCLAIPTLAQVPVNNLDVHRPASRSTVGAVVDMKSDRHFHQLVDNDRVRVFKLEVAALQSTEVNYHRHDYVVLALGKSNFEISGGGIAYPMQMEAGEMQVLKAGAPHQIRNLSETPLQLVELEVLQNVNPEHPICGLNGRECADGRFGSNDEGRYSQSTLFETDTMKLARIELGPRGALPPHRYDRGHVLIALADLQLQDDSTDGAAKELHLKKGEAVWFPASITHHLKNLDSQETQFITADFR